MLGCFFGMHFVEFLLKSMTLKVKIERKQKKICASFKDPDQSLEDNLHYFYKLIVWLYLPPKSQQHWIESSTAALFVVPL